MPQHEQETRREHYAHRLSYSTKERLVGLFLFLGFVLILATLFASSKTQHFFDERFMIYGSIKTAEGVKRGTAVRISGINVGEVVTIDIQEDNTIIVTMEIFSRFHQLLRADSTAKLGKLSLLGQSSIEITAGSADKKLLAKESTLIIEEIRTLDDIIAQITPVIESVVSTIDHVSKIVTAVDPEDIKHSVKNLATISEHIKDLSNQIDSGSGFLSTLIQDENFNTDLRKSANHLENSLAKVPELIESIQVSSQKINTMLGSNTKNSNSDLMLKVKVALDELDKTLKGIQRIWPLSSAVSQPKTEIHGLIPPEGAHE